MEALINIQSELNAPKTLRNNFGNYNYRSAESILEAVKPLLKKYGCQLTLSDDISMFGDRFYIKSTASINDGKETVSVTAFAREEESKKGMDSAQLTGATSSYARKYALNGLFCIDDNKDPDTDEFTKETQSKSNKAPKPKSIADIARATADPILKNALTEIDSATDKISLVSVWKSHPTLQGNETFSKCMSAKKKELAL